jgi:hypothetical protein
MKTFERYCGHFCLTILLLCVAGVAEAATGNASITLTRPTAYTDGSPLAASAITGYAVDCQFTATGATSSTTCTLTGSPLPGGTATGGNVTLTYPAAGGNACFVLRTLVGALSSAGGTPVCKALPGVPPNDPTNVTITVTLAINLESASEIRVASVEVAKPVVAQSP